MKYLCDLHTHSVLSRHAFSSLTENIAYAKDVVKLKYYGISEHQPDKGGYGAHKFAVNNTKIIPRNIDGMVFLSGCEFNILEGPHIDLMGVRPDKLDYGIASYHEYATRDNMGEEANTQGYLKALDYDFITIIGHMDRNFICDYENVIKKAKDKHKLIELNNASLNKRNGACWERDKIILPLCLKHKCPIIINSDAHVCYDIGKHDLADKLLDELHFPKEMVLNYNEELFLEYFKV